MCNKFVQSRLPNYLASTLCFVSGNRTYGSHTTFRPSIRLGKFLLIGLLYTLHVAAPLHPGYHDQAIFNHVQCSTTTRKEYISSIRKMSRIVISDNYSALTFGNTALTASLTEISCFIST